MGGFDVSPGLVSRAAAELDDQVRKWRERHLAAHVYSCLIMDARYEKVCRGGRIVSTAVLFVCGINDNGQREVLGYWLGNSEGESSWGEAFAELKEGANTRFAPTFSVDLKCLWITTPW